MKQKHWERETDTHIYFWRGALSNWHSCEFQHEGHTFQNSEQAFMWEKAMYFEDYDIADKILKTPNPRENKKLGRQVKNFNTEIWMTLSFGIMAYVNKSKWTSSKKMKKLLLSTGDKILVEASPYDKIWGVGLESTNDLILNEGNWEGMNLLGKALMETRKVIKTL